MYEEEEEDDDDDSVDDDDEKDDGNKASDIGDIADILNSEKLLYLDRDIKRSEEKGRNERTIRSEYEKYLRKFKDSIKDENAPRFRRINMILDRRNNLNEDDQKINDPNQVVNKFYTFNPPDNCNSFDYNEYGGHVPEIFIANSKTSTLPHKGYRESIMSQKASQQNFTFNATEQLEGRNFILSFHVQAIDEVKAYVYYNGTICRFYPNDMVYVWPNYFKPTEKNKQFAKNKASLLNELKNLTIRDDRFQHWYKLTTGFDDPYSGPVSDSD